MQEILKLFREIFVSFKGLDGSLETNIKSKWHILNEYFNKLLNCVLFTENLISNTADYRPPDAESPSV